jgi:predicted alpha/beta superfamily hydrolase
VVQPAIDDMVVNMKQQIHTGTKDSFRPAWRDYRAHAPGSHTVSGNLLVLPKLYSPQLNNERDVLVYLPPDYYQSSRPYPVVYMHDGQNLFDSATSFGGQEWGVDETMERLSHEGMPAIVVGLPHMGQDRIIEYNPFAVQRGGRGERYLSFVTDTLKPLIDRELRTQPDRTSTGLFGSSMGGLISLYGFFLRPDVFGFVGSMSPALWYARQAIYGFVQQAAPVPGRIYLDHGSRENTAARMRTLLLDKGYVEGQNLMYVNEAGGEHSESAWARRLPGALRFLLDGV